MAPHIAKILAQVEMLLASRIADGQLRAIKAEQMLRIAASMFMGYLLASSLPLNRTWDDEAEIAIMAGIMARGLAAD
jgi:hypothetical protein